MSDNYRKMTTTELSTALQRDRTTIFRWNKAGLKKNRDGKTYDLSRVVEWLLDRERETCIEKEAETGGPSPWLEKWREERAKIERIKRKQLEGSVIAIEDVHQQWAARVSEITSSLERLADRMPPLLVGKPREEMAELIRGEIWTYRDSYARTGKYCETTEGEP